MSRSAPDYQSKGRFVSADLLESGDCRDKLGGLGDVTHLFFAAYREMPTEAERVEINGAMLRNVVEAIEAAAPGLQRIVLMQGTKYYGGHRARLCRRGVQHHQRRLFPLAAPLAPDRRALRHGGRPPVPIRLAEFIADKGPVWDDLVRRRALRPYRYEQIVSWPFGDFVFGCDYDVISDTTRARRYGFHEAVDTEEMFVRMFRDLRDQRYIP